MVTADKTTYNIHEAKTHLSKLLKRLEAGETIVITRAGKPVAMLKPFVDQGKRRVPGIDAGKVFIHDDWDDPLPEFEEYM